MGEINVYGIYIPILLIHALIAYVLLKVLSPVLDRLVSKGWIALPSIFNLCVYLGLVLLVHGLFVMLWA